MLDFPCRGAVKTWELRKTKVKEWITTFPGLSLEMQMKRAKQWLIDNPGRQKTARGMTRFLYRWLEKACNGK